MKANFTLAIMTILFSLFFLVVALRMPETNSSTPVGPAEWPIIVLTFMLIMGIMLFIKTFLEVKRGTNVSEESTGQDPELDVNAKEKEGMDHSHWFILAAIAAYVFLLPIVGFLIVTPLLFVFLAWFLGIRRISHLVTMTVAGSAGFLVLFIYLLGIPFPRGTGVFRALSLFVY
ncbi:tripartite tricarboxylate transporter TctB family protein [Thalassobacillus sp. CUG 92003]|uniref:tripartite tricarboxylate transporter TctB family protein n=1 Tax=Thalassobacillus sp. CUG 92003 TaxID=2736641 RepID=UPI0015E6DC38|nr:tripartite tricarboxylate transporter TctB family protein [Thalassobacillus sp. CUG 92003]